MRQNLKLLVACGCAVCLSGIVLLAAPAPVPKVPAAKEAPAPKPPAAVPPAPAVKPFYFLGPHLFPYNPTIAGLIAADVNGDGKLDLTFIDNRLSKIQMLLQRSKEDKDEKSASTSDRDVNKIDADRLLKKADFLTNQQVTAYTLMRIGEKRPAIAYFCRTKELYIAVRGDDGQWKNQQRFLLDLKSTFCGGFEAADLNGDAREDLIFLAEDGVMVFVQQPDGKLAEPELYPVAEQKSSSLKFGDVSGDGRADLLYIAPDEL